MVVNLNGEDATTIPIRTMQVFSLSPHPPSSSDSNRLALHHARQPKDRDLPTLSSGHANWSLLRLHVLSIRQRTSSPRISHRPLSKQMVGPPRARNITPLEPTTRSAEHAGRERNPRKNDITNDTHKKHTSILKLQASLLPNALHLPVFPHPPVLSLPFTSVVPYVPLSPLCDHGYPKCFVYHIRYSYIIMQASSPIGGSSNHTVNKGATLLHCAWKTPSDNETREKKRSERRVCKFVDCAKRDRWTKWRSERADKI